LVALFHQVKVIVPELVPLLEPPLLVPPPLLQAASTRLVAAAATMAATARLFIIECSSPRGGNGLGWTGQGEVLPSQPRPCRKFLGALSMVPSS
jgi:hypothetical protein